MNGREGGEEEAEAEVQGVLDLSRGDGYGQE
jgi:hypothetical protein